MKQGKEGTGIKTRSDFRSSRVFLVNCYRIPLDEGSKVPIAIHHDEGPYVELEGKPSQTEGC